MRLMDGRWKFGCVSIIVLSARMVCATLEDVSPGRKRTYTRALQLSRGRSKAGWLQTAVSDRSSRDTIQRTTEEVQHSGIQARQNIDAPSTHTLEATPATSQPLQFTDEDLSVGQVSSRGWVTFSWAKKGGSSNERQ
ncbi:hypothetical protein BJ322DRAFT_532860 [Thelephora terrestris]|uniref:Secreted protein n=1 Tax=Thelephora terrestris TaxID=56493 RepID=A0A9P6LAE7_9AGAM|nr:hypothetical protein BJ322DRAFT_532860 [Thelephora terrestris]